MRPDKISWVVITLLLYLLFCLMAPKAKAQGADPTLPPLPPSGVEVSGIRDTKASVAWRPMEGATQYSVWVGGSRRAGTNSPGVEVSGLKPNTAYSVCVTAANDAGESEPSPTVTFTTLPPLPVAPARPVVKQVTSSSALIEWEPLPHWQHIQTYRIYLDGRKVKDVLPKDGMQATEFQGLPPGKHVVSVAGVNANGEGSLSPSAEFTVAAIPTPTGLRMFNHSVDTLWLTLDKAEGVNKYRVMVDGQLKGETKENTYVLSGLQPGQAHQVDVIAVSSDGNQSPPATLMADTLPTPEPVSFEGYLKAITPYVEEMVPGIIALFAIGGAAVLMRLARLPLSFRIRW